MKILVLGAGAIGSFYGTKLSKLNDVALVARQKHAGEINKNGLKVIGLEDNTYTVKAITKIEKIEDNTLILLTTKVYDSEKAISDIKDLIKKDTIILCLQNGLYSEDIVKKIVKDKCLVLRGITNYGVVFFEPGIIENNNDGATSIEKSDVSKDLADNFDKCELNCHVSENINQEVWKKLILNCVLNPITTILRIKNGEMVNENLNPLKKLVIDECLKVAEKENVKFDIDFVKMINKRVKGSKNISSMQQDIIKGKKTEIDYLNGAVVELGKKYGIKCPVNEGLIMIVRGMEK